jgi:hypothetical protein
MVLEAEMGNSASHEVTTFKSAIKQSGIHKQQQHAARTAVTIL